MQIVISNSKSDRLGLGLILISSALLGIWATMNTIALRNALLGFGSLLAIAYWLKWLSAAKSHSKLRLPFVAWTPLCLIALMFLWVVVHFAYFSTDPQRQLHELGSTWIRAFLATLIGSATGLALSRNWAKAPFLWLGLMLSFITLMYQYIPKALQRQSFFAMDFFADYIYWAKFNGVLAGTLLIAGVLGLLVDYFRINDEKAVTKNFEGAAYLKEGRFIPAYALFSIFLATYSFVFIFDAKAGVGLSVILIGFWVLVGLVYLVTKILKSRKQKNSLNAYMRLCGLVLIFVTLASFLVYKHVKNNPGWESLFEDVAISAQIDTYPNWQNPSKFGVPLRNDGTAVAGNTYERISWATVGLRLITIQPFGSGVFRSFPEQVKTLVPEFNSAAYTHSAWIDLGLAFGFPGLLIIPVALLLIFVRAISLGPSRYKATIITLALATLILYTVGEYAFQHGIEILFYLCSLLAGLSLCEARNSAGH